jgi:hypothetical protein
MAPRVSSWCKIQWGMACFGFNALRHKARCVGWVNGGRVILPSDWCNEPDPGLTVVMNREGIPIEIITQRGLVPWYH